MLFPDYTSPNHHRIAVYGRMMFTATSASRKDMIHFVDLEGFEGWKSVCTCESWRYGERPCRHIKAVLSAISHWAKVPEEAREEWEDRLMFLLSLGYSFAEAINSESLRILKPEKKVRQYALK